VSELDDLARTLAEGMPRRRALRVMAGAVAAAVVASNAFGLREGIAVDTHVLRVSGRLRLTRHADPIRVERDLMRLYPRERWLEVSDVLIFHGRRICNARRPRCEDCAVEDSCPSSLLRSVRKRAAH